MYSVMYKWIFDLLIVRVFGNHINEL